MYMYINKEKKSITIVDYICLFLVPFIALSLMEGIHRRAIFGIFVWLIEHPLEVAVSYVLLWGVYSLFILFSIRAYYIVSTILTVALSGFAYGSSVKLEFRGEPIIPSDLLMMGEAGEVSSYLPKNFGWMIGFIFLCICALFFLIWKVTKNKQIPRIPRFVLPVISVIILTLAITGSSWKLDERLGLKFIGFEQRANYSKNGLMLAFLENTKYLKVEKPANYSKETIEKIVSALEKEQLDATASLAPANGKKPNVIVVMSESFSDPSLLPNVKFSEDPMPTVRALRDEHIGGKMNVSVFGGGTANSEFEALTGMSVKLLSPGVTPYIQYMNRPMPSMAWQFRQAGYDATAMTTWHNWFYKINNAYKDMGFNHLVSKEFFPAPEMAGSYIKDMELMKEIVDHVKRSDKPSFVYAVTMEGHGPYPSTPGKGPITAEGPLSPESKASLEYYANTIHNIDQSLKWLADQLKAIDEPTIVAFFGDHMPSLGKVYDEIGFRDKGDYASYIGMYETPFVMWDNYSNQKDDLTMSTSFLSSYLLERAGVPGNALTNFMGAVHKNGTQFVVGDRYLKDAKFPKDAMDTYKLLQYDILFGQQYSMKKSEIPVTAGYSLGVPEEHPQIEKIIPAEDGIFHVMGTKLTEGCKIIVDGNEISTTYDSPTQLTIKVDKDKLIGKDIEIHLLDSINLTIYKSNTFKYDGK